MSFDAVSGQKRTRISVHSKEIGRPLVIYPRVVFIIYITRPTSAVYNVYCLPAYIPVVLYKRTCICIMICSIISYRHADRHAISSKKKFLTCRTNVIVTSDKRRGIIIIMENTYRADNHNIPYILMRRSFCILYILYYNSCGRPRYT